MATTETAGAGALPARIDRIEVTVRGTKGDLRADLSPEQRARAVADGARIGFRGSGRRNGLSGHRATDGSFTLSLVVDCDEFELEPPEA